MFLIRSAFWLGLALMVLQPQGWNIGAAAGALTTAADEGRAAVAQHAVNIPCDSIECAGGKALLLASGLTNNPSQASTMQDSPSLKPAPVPRPRLARAG